MISSRCISPSSGLKQSKTVDYTTLKMETKGSPKRRWLIINRYLITTQKTSVFVKNAMKTKTLKFNWYLHLFAIDQSVRDKRPRNRVSIPRKKRDFSVLRNVQIIFGAPRASSSLSNRGSSEEKGDRNLKLTIHSPPTSIRLEIWETVPPSPHIASRPAAEQFELYLSLPIAINSLKKCLRTTDLKAHHHGNLSSVIINMV